MAAKKSEKEAKGISLKLEPVEVDRKGHKDNANVLSALAYFFSWPVDIILLLVEKEDEFVRFSAAQSLVFSVAVFAFWMIGFILSVVVIGLLILPLVFIAYLLLWAYLTYLAFNWKSVRLPYIAEYADMVEAALGKGK